MKKYLSILLFLTLLYSCEGFLDEQSRSYVDADKMFETDQGFKDALTACYTKMNARTLYGEYLTMTRIELMAQHWDLDESRYPGLLAFKDLDFTTDDSKSTFSSIYGNLYNVIVEANDILNNIPTKGQYISNTATRGVIEAEALALRAFCHMEILRLFGQMPKNAQIHVALPYAKTVGKESIPYYDYDNFVKLILQDFDRAEELFKQYDPLVSYSLLEMDPGTTYTNDIFLTYRRFRMNLYAVKALKARLYLYIGETTKAYNCAREVISTTAQSGDQIVELANNDNLSIEYYALPTECIFALNNFKLSNYVSSLFTVYDYRLTEEHLNELFAGCNASSNNRLLFLWNKEERHTNGHVFPLIRKYDQPATGSSVSSTIIASRRQVIPIIRLSEMYLIVLETTTSLTEANKLYVEYMNARNEIIDGDLTQNDLDNFIETEYRREFFAEGQMFYYYKRKGSTTMLWRTAGTLTENNYIVPLPATEINPNGL